MSAFEEDLSEMSALSTDILHRVLQDNGAIVGQAAHLAGHIIDPKARRAVLLDGHNNDHRVHKVARKDGHLNDRKARKAALGGSGQGNPTTVETLRLAGQPIGTRPRRS